MHQIFREWHTLIPALFNNMAVVILCAYIFSHSSSAAFSGEKRSRRHLILLTAIASALGIYGTISSIPVLDVQSNIRNIGPIIGGLLGGPIVGLIAGIISGMHRYFMGGPTASPCALAAIFAGLFTGWLYRRNKNNFIGIWKAVFATLFVEVMHTVFILIMHNSFKIALTSQTITLPVRMAVEGLGIALFSFIVIDILKNQRARDEKLKVERELAIAREIQMSIVPKIFPPKPGWPDVEIYGAIQPAREVAGDFYDFFKIDDSTICFSVGDVSDKGVPASLFMAVTKTLLKAKCDGVTDPAELLTKVNQELCDGNDSLMFVTLFTGILDTRTGLLKYCNAGHTPPVLLNRMGNSELDIRGGMALGAMEDAIFTTNTIQLEHGDLLFIYTDGLTDAKNSAGEVMGDDAHLRLTANFSKNNKAQDLVVSVLENVNAFQNNSSPYDDITLLAIKLKEPELVNA